MMNVYSRVIGPGWMAVTVRTAETNVWTSKGNDRFVALDDIRELEKALAKAVVLVRDHTLSLSRLCQIP